MVVVRAAVGNDAVGVRRVHLSAFPTSQEAGLVDRLIEDGDAVVSLVAVEEEAIVGHILLSRMTVTGDSHPLYALGLAPVAVLRDRQNAGIGSKLIEAALDEARSIGAEMVFVLGEPDYYGRLGFTAAAALPFASPYAGPHFQAAVLDPDYRPPTSGTAAYAPAFQSLS